jgi:thymidylate synthase (FAD)
MREFQRHRVGWSYNEESGRYRELQPVFYLPSDDRSLVQTGKPGHYTFEAGTEEQRQLTAVELAHTYVTAWKNYRTMLDAGIAREVARMCLPVATYSSMYATCNARSLMHLLSLRTRRDDSAFPSFPQREIEMVAEKLEAELKLMMPLTHTAFEANGRVAP